MTMPNHTNPDNYYVTRWTHHDYPDQLLEFKNSQDRAAFLSVPDDCAHAIFEECDNHDVPAFELDPERFFYYRESELLCWYQWDILSWADIDTPVTKLEAGNDKQ